jgi:hypothetical protein
MGNMNSFICFELQVIHYADKKVEIATWLKFDIMKIFMRPLKPWSSTYENRHFKALIMRSKKQKNSTEFERDLII